MVVPIHIGGCVLVVADASACLLYMEARTSKVMHFLCIQTRSPYMDDYQPRSPPSHSLGRFVGSLHIDLHTISLLAAVPIWAHIVSLSSNFECASRRAIVGQGGNELIVQRDNARAGVDRDMVTTRIPSLS